MTQSRWLERSYAMNFLKNGHHTTFTDFQHQYQQENMLFKGHGYSKLCAPHLATHPIGTAINSLSGNGGAVWLPFGRSGPARRLLN